MHFPLSYSINQPYTLTLRLSGRTCFIYLINRKIKLISQPIALYQFWMGGMIQVALTVASCSQGHLDCTRWPRTALSSWSHLVSAFLYSVNFHDGKIWTDFLGFGSV